MKSTSGNIFLVGLMGAGKSTIGRQIARRLGKRFVDADRELESRLGVTIPVIFDIEGEAGFRRREAALLEELTNQTGVVLATGGGAVECAETRHFLRARGITIYLSASAEELCERTRNDRNRPLLQTPDPRLRLEQLLLRRESWYREVADLTIETGQPNVSKLAMQIIDTLKLHPQAGRALFPAGLEDPA